MRALKQPNIWLGSRITNLQSVTQVLRMEILESGSLEVKHSIFYQQLNFKILFNLFQLLFQLETGFTMLKGCYKNEIRSVMNA